MLELSGSTSAANTLTVLSPQSSSSVASNSKVNKKRSTAIQKKFDIVEEEEESWPKVDVGNLILDLEQDINQDNTMSTTTKTSTISAAGTSAASDGAAASNSSSDTSSSASTSSGGHSASGMTSGTGNSDKGLKMKIKRKSTNSGNSGNSRNPVEGKLEIVSSSEEQTADAATSLAGSSGNMFLNGHNNKSDVTDSSTPSASSDLSAAEVVKAVTAAAKQSGKVLNSGKVKLTGGGCAKVKLTGGGCATNNKSTKLACTNSKNGKLNGNSISSNGSQDSNSSSYEPPVKRQKVDAGVSTEMATMTEPDALGPMDPGSSVTLEGIVWHETENGILVINVTWRGKTYVGTLLDSTRHVNQWAPPRYSDSPTLELESSGRTPKGRGKRGNRGAAGTPVESETRKNLRSSKGKGRNQINFSGNSSPTKDKGKNDKSSDNENAKSKRQRTSSRNSPEEDEDSEKEKEGENKAEEKEKQPKEEDEMTPKDTEDEKYVPPPPLPYALKCPKPGCKKRYRHHDGLKFHISFAHKELLNSRGDIKDMSEIEKIEQEAKIKMKKRENDDSNTEESSNSCPSSKTSTPGPSELTAPSSASQDSTLPAAITTASQLVSTASLPPTVPSSTATSSSSRMSEESKMPISLAALGQLKPNFNKLPIPPADAKPIPVSAIEGGVVPNSRPPPPLLTGPPMNVASSGLPVTTIIGNLPPISTMNKPLASKGAIRPPSNARPIVPATAPQLLTAGGLVKPIQPRPTIMAEPTPNLSLEELRRKKEPKKKKDNSPGTSPPRNLNGNLPKAAVSAKPDVNQPVSQPKGKASSPYSDISDDNDDPSIEKKLSQDKKKTDLPAASSSRMNPMAFPYVIPPQSSPQLPTTPISAVPSSKPSCDLSKFEASKDKMGGALSNPLQSSLEYQKMLQAYGFPPVPYPIPPGIDPAMHIHLLNADPNYRAKFERDRGEKDKVFKDPNDRDAHEKEKRAHATLKHVEELSRKTPEDLRKKDPMIPGLGGLSVKPEFNLKSEPTKAEPATEEGAKPTMETRGPPPSTNPFGYGAPGSSMLRAGFPGLPYDLGLANSLLLGAGTSPYGPNPYLSPHLRPPFGATSMADLLRPGFLPPNLPEDLTRAAASGLSTTKALDLLQQQANTYYNNQKIQELQERALKSPGGDKASPKPSEVAPSPSLRKGTPSPASSGPMASLSSLTTTTSSQRSPPPLRHVHTHTHTHFGLGYPLLPPPAVGSGMAPPAAHTPFPAGAFPSSLMPPKSVLPSNFPPPK